MPLDYQEHRGYSRLDRCPVCNSSEIAGKFHGVPRRSGWKDESTWHVWTCNSCGHGFINPQPGTDVLNRYYERSYSAYDTDHGVAKDIEEAVAAARKEGSYRHVTIEPAMRVLDVGCGGGSFLRVAKALGATTMGVEPSSQGVESCRKNGVTAFHGDLSSFMATGPDPFDLVTANHVVEHHPDPVSLISEMSSLARPGGSIWISIPNAGCFFARALRDRWHSCDLPVHLHHFTEKSIRLAFARAGLEPDDLKTESENSLGASLAALLKWRLRIPSRVTKAVFGPLLKKNRMIGRWIDASGQGEALIVSARVRDP